MSTAAEPVGRTGSSPDDGPDRGSGERTGERTGVLAPQHRRTVAGIVLTALFIAFEAMAVATAMPVAARELHGLVLYAWGFSAFLTTSLVGMVVAGERCDVSGPRAPFLAGVATFGAGLGVAGAAPGMSVFIGGRALQGFGMGLTVVALYVIVGRAFVEELRPRVFSVMSAAWVLPSVVGPVVAGWLADTLTWRWVFLGVLPLLVPSLLLVLPALRGIAGVGGAVGPGTGRPSRSRGRLPVAVAAATGAALLQYAGQHLIVSSLLVLVGALALLGPSLPRLLPPGTLRAARGLPTTVLTRGVLAGAFFGAETFVPLMLVEERRLSTTLAGLSLTGGALGWASGSWYQGRPATRLSRPRLVQLGCALVAAGVVGVALAVLPGLPPYIAAVAWTVGGAGMGLAMTSVGVLVLEQSPLADQGANSAALQLCDAVFSVVFIGIGGVLFAGLHERAQLGDRAFLTIDAVMVALALVGVAIAPRVQATGGGPR